jgi:hypothetical protein
MPDDPAKRLILARRARFVAAALASMAVSCGKEHAAKVDAGPGAVDAGVDASVSRPHPCLCVCQEGDPLCSCL